MMGIVFEHSSVVGGIYTKPFDVFLEISLIQSFKFSTIAFFLIGGFLINHKFQEYSALQYLRNRVKNTIKPWIFWMFIFALTITAHHYVLYTRGSDELLITNTWLYLQQLFSRVLFFSPYWFILNFLICISILLIFKKYLYNLWFGLGLCLLSLFYSINLYFGWIETIHSTALFGFVFYLWLGAYFNRFYGKVTSIVQSAQWWGIISIVIITFLLAVTESHYLLSIGSTDAYNTLRITNILYSFAMFAALLKIGNIKWLQRILKPRETTFGIYLIHIIVIERLFHVVFYSLKLNFQAYSIYQNTALLLIKFFLAYTISFFLTWLISKTKAKWIIGQ